jgi:hypothetical protein
MTRFFTWVMAEVHRGQPVDADVNVGLGFLATRDVELAAAWCTAADEHRIESFGQQRLHRADVLTTAKLDAQVQDVADFFVDHLLGQAEARHLRAHEATGLLVAVEHRDRVALRRQVARHGQRGRARTDTGHTLAVLRLRPRDHCAHFVALEVGGHAFQPADGHRLGLGARRITLLHAPATASRLAGAVAGAAQHAGKDVAYPVDHVGVVVATLRDQADVFGDGGVGRTGPLAIDDLVEVRGVGHVRGQHGASSPAGTFAVRRAVYRLAPMHHGTAYPEQPAPP